MKIGLKIIAVVLLSLFLSSSQSEGTYELALLKYRGGGDWYANPTSLPNLIQFCVDELNIPLSKEYRTVEAGSPDIFNFPFIHMTGHGNVEWNAQERDNLRNYLLGGGFLHIDDNYGMDQYVRNQLQLLFPDHPLEELAVSHPIFHAPFNLEDGLPKIHEHDGNAPQALGIQIDGRLVVFYSFESDLGDGWEDPEVHNDSEVVRRKALMMGANLVTYAFNGAVYVQND